MLTRFLRVLDLLLRALRSVVIFVFFRNRKPTLKQQARAWFIAAAFFLIADIIIHAIGMSRTLPATGPATLLCFVTGIYTARRTR